MSYFITKRASLKRDFYSCLIITIIFAVSAYVTRPVSEKDHATTLCNFLCLFGLISYVGLISTTVMSLSLYLTRTLGVFASGILSFILGLVIVAIYGLIFVIVVATALHMW